MYDTSCIVFFLTSQEKNARIFSGDGKDMQREPFRNQFWLQVKRRQAASDAMHKVPSGSHNRLVRVLEAISDPAIDGRMKRWAPKIVNQLIPSNKKLIGLANRLRTIGKELEGTAKLPGFVLGSNGVLEIAKQCRAGAGYLAILKPASFAKVLSYKSFWKCVPTAMLCHELVDSRILSFQEVEELVWCADIARGRTRARPKRSIERQYKGFSAHFSAGAWPIWLQGFLDCALKT